MLDTKVENMAGIQQISNAKIKSEHIQKNFRDFNNMINSFTLSTENFEPVAIKPLKDDSKIKKFF